MNHVGSVCQMCTGDILAGRPALGSWATYGLGAANESLPAFVILTDAAEVNGGPKNWSSGFLPSVYSGTRFRNTGDPILNVSTPEGIAPGTRWEDVPESWTCPDCSATKADFEMVVVSQ